MNIQYSRPVKGNKKEKTIEFLNGLGLGWDDGNETTVNLMNGNDICATGSRQGKILKCIGTSREEQGNGLAAVVVTELMKDAMRDGHSHLFLFTKPENTTLFESLGFYPIVQTKDVAFMENRKDGVFRFISEIRRESARGVIAAIVANCDPFTNGHLHLVQKAAEACDFVYLFILSEDRGFFRSSVRFELAQAATEHLVNVAVCPTGDYLVSTATFPQYFLKNKTHQVEEISCALDIAIFAECFAPRLGITRRFVGSEPYCPVTFSYNQQMKKLLPERGVDVIEIERCYIGESMVSASHVRDMLADNRLSEIAKRVPPCTYQYLTRCEKPYRLL